MNSQYDIHDYLDDIETWPESDWPESGGNEGDPL